MLLRVHVCTYMYVCSILRSTTRVLECCKQLTLMVVEVIRNVSVSYTHLTLPTIYSV